jgi:hypothetical protein
MPFRTITASESKAIELLKKRLSGFETKEGTTWVQQICHQLRTGGDMEFEEISQVVPWIELARDQGQDLEAEQVVPPRCFKTHCWYGHCQTLRPAQPLRTLVLIACCEQLRTSAGSLAPGPDWMRTRGWSQTEWQLTRELEATQ